MPQRLSVKTVPSEAVQGADSFVKLRSLTVGEAKALMGEADDEARGTAALSKVIAGWNWVDDDGSPLPQVSDDPAVIDKLTNDEIQFILGAITATPKN